jgi:hypothetical protein
VIRLRSGWSLRTGFPNTDGIKARAEADASPADAAIPLRLTLMLEGVGCRS